VGWIHVIEKWNNIFRFINFLIFAKSTTYIYLCSIISYQIRYKKNYSTNLSLIQLFIPKHANAIPEILLQMNQNWLRMVYCTYLYFIAYLYETIYYVRTGGNWWTERTVYQVIIKSIYLVFSWRFGDLPLNHW
jgi:hypothetical protein